jgi:hypothetical protein
VLHNERKSTNTCVVQGIEAAHSLVSRTVAFHAPRRRKPHLVEMASGIGLIHRGSRTCLMYLNCTRLDMRVSLLWAPFACGASTTALLCCRAAPTDGRGGSGFVSTGSGADKHGDVDAGTDASVASSGGSGSRPAGDSDGVATTPSWPWHSGIPGRPTTEAASPNLRAAAPRRGSPPSRGALGPSWISSGSGDLMCASPLGGRTDTPLLSHCPGGAGGS